MSLYTLFFSRGQKESLRFVNFLLIALTAAHFADKDPDEPESAGDEREQNIADEVPESILLTHDEGLSFV